MIHGMNLQILSVEVGLLYHIVVLAQKPDSYYDVDNNSFEEYAPHP